MQHPKAVTHGRNTRIISKAVAIPPERPKITTCADGMVVSGKQTISIIHAVHCVLKFIYNIYLCMPWGMEQDNNNNTL